MSRDKRSEANSGLIDSHVHFDDPRLDADRDVVYSRALAAGIEAMIVPSVSAATWQRTRTVCKQYPGCYPAYGLHPYFTEQHTDSDLLALQQLLQQQPAVAIGECGLDFRPAQADRQRQITLFQAQLELARDTRLPIIVHANKAVETVLDCIRNSGHDRGMIHSYNGSLQQAERLLEQGFLMGFGGAITNPHARRLRKLVQQLPVDALLLETDAPDQPPWGQAGTRNEPAHLQRVLECLIELRQESKTELQAACRRNARRLFDLTEDAGVMRLTNTQSRCRN